MVLVGMIVIAGVAVIWSRSGKRAENAAANNCGHRTTQGGDVGLANAATKAQRSGGPRDPSTVGMTSVRPYTNVGVTSAVAAGVAYPPPSRLGRQARTPSVSRP